MALNAIICDKREERGILHIEKKVVELETDWSDMATDQGIPEAGRDKERIYP